MMTDSLDQFVPRTLELLEKEREAEIDETRHFQEGISFKELERRGVCLLRLRLSSQHSGLYGRHVLVFEPFWADKGLPAHNISSGDIAGLSESSAAAQERDSLGSGIVTRVTANSISVAFDDSFDNSLNDNTNYKLVKLANDVTYRRIKRALEELRKFRGGRSNNLVDVLFGSEPGPPLGKERDGAAAEYLGNLVFFNEKLDESQQEAVKFALKQRELAIIHGPPGTGKTTTVVEIIRQAVNMNMKILVCAPSNIAVDNLVERLATNKTKMVRLGHPARLLPSIQHYALDAVIARSEEAEVTNALRQDLDKAMAKLEKTNDKGERQKLRNEVRFLRKDLRQQETTAVSRVLKACQVILATLTTATDAGPIKHLEEEHFDLVVIDECSQALEAACWQVLLRAPRCVLAGDHKQLPPTIISKEAAKEGLERTLMERQIDLHGAAAMRMLTTQYRMHHRIMQWPSQQLYGGQLKAHESVAHHLLKDLPDIEECEETSVPLLLIDTTGCDLQELDLPDEISKGNEGEVELVVAHVDKLIRSGLNEEDIAVIAPYNLQVELLRLKLASQHPKLEIKSVDGFQGREKEAVVISLVRSNEKGEVGFLAEDRRINVAITRARRHLAVICDTETVGHHAFLKSLVDYMMDNGDVRSAQQYIQDGIVEISSKRPEFLETKISEVTNLKKNKEAKNKGDQRKENKKYKPTSTPKSHAASNFVPENRESDEDRLAAIEKTLQEFTQSTKTEYAFDSTLTSWQRKKVHEVAEGLGLVHISQGEGQERYILVRKLTPKQEPIVERMSHGQEPRSSGSSKDHTSENKSAQPGKSTKKKVKDKVRTEVAEQKDAEQGVEVTQVDQNTQDKVSNDASEAHDVKCAKCGKDIPAGNLQLHELRCQGVPASISEGARPKTRKKNKGKNKQKLDEIAKPEDSDDFDDIIAAAMKENTTCAFLKCKALTTTIGMNCDFCARRYCLSHHIPEIHGCGSQARIKARQVTIRAGVVYRGSGVPDKKVDPIKRAHLERKLDKKLGELTDKRAHKTQEKKS